MYTRALLSQVTITDLTATTDVVAVVGGKQPPSPPEGVLGAGLDPRCELLGTRMIVKKGACLEDDKAATAYTTLRFLYGLCEGKDIVDR